MVLMRSGSRLADMMMKGKAPHPFRALKWGLCRSCLLSRTRLFKENSSRLMGSPVPGTTRGVMSKGVGREPWNSGGPFPQPPLKTHTGQAMCFLLERVAPHP